MKEYLEKYKANLLSVAKLMNLKLDIITVGNDPASEVYVRNKIKFLEEAGVEVKHIKLHEGINQHYLDGLCIHPCNVPTLIQLPLPKHLKCPDLPLNMDVDGFGSEALGYLAMGNPLILPCTVQACIDIIFNKITYVRGKNIAVIGRSNIVGKPLAIELINRGATVTVFSSHSELPEGDQWDKYDVVVVATGHHGVVKSSDFQGNQLVIDVGINRVDGKIVGDVRYDGKPYDAYITPVPGGVGPMTVMNVLGNLIKLKEMRDL